MTILTRFCLCAIVASGLLVSAVSVSPEWFATVGLDFWSLPELHARLAKAQADHGRLQLAGERVRDRLEIKRQTALAVMDGRLTLFAAAVRFREVNLQEPQAMAYLHTCLPGRSDDEKLCHQVLEWVSTELTLGQTPSEEHTIRARLESELQEHLAKHGKVILP